MNPRFVLALLLSLPFLAPAAVTSYLTLETVDADTGEHISSLIRITDGEGRVKELSNLLNRGIGLRKNHPASQWYCHNGREAVKDLQGDLMVEVFAGPEYEMTKGNVRVQVGQRVGMKLKLRRIASPRATGWRSGNTHLHIMKLTRAQADQYLRTVPRSDGLELVFVSNLRRAKAELEYITNEHRTADLKKLESAGLRFGWGEEHRHNYGGGG